MSAEPVWIVDNDADDQEIVRMVWQDLGLENELTFFSSAEEAYDTLAANQRAPFIIVCDLNLPGTDGFEFRQRLLDTHQKKFKSVPFIFWTSQASESQITRAYDLSAHGLFIKDSTIEALKDTFRTIIRYWFKSKTPAKSDGYRSSAKPI
jgi:CheY-like chemotaxis protein